MVRRCFLIRLDTEMQRPWTRSDFRHQQPQWAQEHCSELAGALLTLARAWFAAGQPDPDTPTLGSFEKWCHVVGGILQNAGFEGFLGNQDELTDTEFSEDNRWSVLLEAIHNWQRESLDGEPFTTRALAERIEAHENSAEFTSADSDISLDSNSSLMEPIVGYLPEEILRKVRKGEPFTQSLGKTFGWNEDRRFPGGWFLVSEGKGREGTLWNVRRDPGPDQGNATADEPSESPPGEGEVGGDSSQSGENVSSHHHERREEAPF
jgi:hypothetical protein